MLGSLVLMGTISFWCLHSINPTHNPSQTPGEQAHAKVEQAWLRDERKNHRQVSEENRHSNITKRRHYPGGKGGPTMEVCINLTRGPDREIMGRAHDDIAHLVHRFSASCFFLWPFQVGELLNFSLASWYSDRPG